MFGSCITEWIYRQTPINFSFYILIGVLAAISHERKVEKEQEKEAARWRAYLRAQRDALQQPGRALPVGV